MSFGNRAIVVLLLWALAGCEKGAESPSAENDPTFRTWKLDGKELNCWTGDSTEDEGAGLSVFCTDFGTAYKSSFRLHANDPWKALARTEVEEGGSVLESKVTLKAGRYPVEIQVEGPNGIKVYNDLMFVIH